jgi:hypothetical protein
VRIRASKLCRAASRRLGLIDRSIATEDEHAIQFTEACLRENMIRPDPVYPAAAAHATEFLRRDN